MLVVAFLQWWYGPGWRDAGDRLSASIRTTYLNFSVPILARTLFAPWRQIISAPGSQSSLQDHLRAFVDNAVSRAVGFTVRLLALFVACLLICIFAASGGILLILWPALPLLGPALIVIGLL